MTLIFLYGAPGVGKLTVATALQGLVGYGVFHNHLTFDLVSAFVKPFTSDFWTMVHQLRLRSLELAADRRVQGVTFTMCYDHPKDKPIVDDMYRLVTDRGGAVHFVQLTCSLEETKRRVSLPDRQRYRKLTRPEKLEVLLKQWDVLTPIDGYNSLRIDNTCMDPDQVAQRIVETFSLLPLTDVATTRS